MMACSLGEAVVLMKGGKNLWATSRARTKIRAWARKSPRCGHAFANPAADHPGAGSGDTPLAVAFLRCLRDAERRPRIRATPPRPKI